MDDTGNRTTRSSTNSSTMENTPKPNAGNKVKLRVAKKKVNLRQKNRLNRSNTSFNTSLNASMKMKQTLRNNNKALAQALQITKQDLAWATDMIANLQKENKNLMMEKAVSNHVISQSIDGQVNEKLKPFVQSTKAKIREATKNLLAVASALQEISSNLTSQFGNISNTNSRVNSLENCQDLPNLEPSKLPSTETANTPKRRSSFCPPPSLRNGSQPINDLNIITESSLLNLNQAQNSIDVLDMVLENESEKYREVNEIKPVKADKPPQRVPVEARRSMSRRDSMNRRQSMDEIDFGPNVVKSRKSRRSSFFLPTGCIDKVLHPSIETSVKNDETCMDHEYQIDENDKKVETEELSNHTLLEDDTTILISEPPIIKSFMKEDKVSCDTNQDLQQELPTTTQFSDSPILFSGSPAEQQQDVDLVVADDSKTALSTQTEEVNNTNVNEIDMELTEVINSSVQINDEVNSLPDTESMKDAEASASTDPVDSQENCEKEDPIFIKPPKVPKRKKTDSKKDEKKQTKNTKEKVNEISTEDENRAVVELRLPKPGKIIFSATRKNIAGIRLSPQKVRSKKKLAELKKNELTAEPKNLFDFHDKTPQMLVKKPEPAETGIYDVSLNDSVYGTCQSLGEYRERVAMAKRISSVNGNCVPSSSTSDAAQTEVVEGKKETAVETVPDTSAKPVEEKKKRARSKKATDGNEEKRMRSRSKKRVADSDSDEDTTYVKHYQKTVKGVSSDAPERELTRRARSKVISYKEVESDFDLTLTEVKALAPLKNAEENQKESSAKTKEEKPKEEKPKEETASDYQDIESKNATKRQTGRKSLKETDEKPTRSRKKSTAENKNTDHSDHLLSVATKNSVAEKSEIVLKGTERIADLMSRLEKLQTKRSRSQHRSETKSEETQNPTEAVSKPKSTTSDIVERYKQALASYNDTNPKGESKKKENSKSRSRPARNETSDKMCQNQKGRSRSLHAHKSDSMDDKVESTLERKRSRSVAKKKTDEPSPPSSPVKKQEESPEVVRKGKTERGRSKSRARSNAKSSMTGTTSVENKPEKSPDSLQRKIKNERGRSRSRVILAKNEDSDAMCNKILASDVTEVDKCEVNSNHMKKVKSRSIAGKELLLKLKSLNDDEENKVSTDTHMLNTDTNARKSAETNVPESIKKTKNSLNHSNQVSDAPASLLTSLSNETPTVSPKRSLEKNYGKRSSEYTTDENQDLKRPRRATKPLSYKEPSIAKKLRQGDKLFGDAQTNSSGSLPKMIDGGGRKRSILENVTNLNC